MPRLCLGCSMFELIGLAAGMTPSNPGVSADLVSAAKLKEGVVHTFNVSGLFSASLLQAAGQRLAENKP